VLRTPSIACDAATRTVFIEVLGDFMVCLLPSLCMLCIWPALRPNTYVVYLDDGRQPHGWQRNWRRYCAGAVVVMVGGADWCAHIAVLGGVVA